MRSDTFKVFLFTDIMFNNKDVLPLALLYQYLSALGYVIENIDKTPSDELMYTRLCSLLPQIYKDLVRIDKSEITVINNKESYISQIRSILFDYEPSDELTIALVRKTLNFLIASCT